MFVNQILLLGVRVSSFPLTDLINGQTIRYVQGDHKNKEPNTDSFIFHISDGVNNSPTYTFSMKIVAVNDEPPVALFEPLMVEFNKQTLLTNATFRVVDFDTSDHELLVSVEEFPKHGRLYLNMVTELSKQANQFSYADLVNNMVSYKMTSKASMGDEITFSITDGNFTAYSKYYILKSLSESAILADTEPIRIEKNEGLQAIAGN